MGPLPPPLPHGLASIASHKERVWSLWFTLPSGPLCGAMSSVGTCDRFAAELCVLYIKWHRCTSMLVHAAAQHLFVQVLDGQTSIDAVAYTRLV
jgi:hypothetical protein